MNHAGPVYNERENRQPFYVQVLTVPVLHHCWSVNLSISGIGLLADQALQPNVGEGDELDLRFRLPDHGNVVCARARIMWAHQMQAPNVEENRLALGLNFTHLGAPHRLALLDYLHSYRFHIAVFSSDGEERELIAAALAEQCHVYFAASEEELAVVMKRGDIVSLLVCGPAEQACRVVENLSLPQSLAELNSPMAQNDLAPRVLFASPASAGVVLSFFNQEKIFRHLQVPLEAERLKNAVLAACQEHGVRTEQRRVALALERALLRRQARSRSVRTLDNVAQDQMVCESDAMRDAVTLARKVAPHKTAVLLQGETGSGKEVLARLIHQLSPRSHQAFVAQDCGALTETLLESELFGHVKGSFTGASSDHPGLFVLADGGTIFLDEIENTTANFQAKLLRVLENGEIRPVGGRRFRVADVRIIAAGNRELIKLAQKGRFRADLYYRLAAFPIEVPSLRRRPEDIVALTHHFVRQANAAMHKKVALPNAQVMEMLLAYDWPGNARELKNIMERAVLLTENEVEISLAALPEQLNAAPSARKSGPGLRGKLADFEKQLIVATLKKHGNVVRRAAKELRMNPITLARRARRYGILDR